MANEPNVVCIFSGKRKSGKDFIVKRLADLIGVELCEVLRLSGPLKQQYANIHGLDVDKLMDSSLYKEKFRKDMIKWGEAKRNQDPSYFCNLATQMAYHDANNLPITKRVWLLSDARRVSDLQYFKQHYSNVLHVRIQASDEVRKSRGWKFTVGVDDAESECGLDKEKFDIIINNDGDENQLMMAITSLQGKMNEVVHQILNRP